MPLLLSEIMMLPIYKSLPLLFLLTLTGCDDNQFTTIIDENWIIDPEICADDTTPVDFKKVAYWSVDEDYDNDDLALIDFSALTHIIYTSVSVSADGSLATLSDDNEEILEDLVEYAQLAGVKVSVSLGDGNDNSFNSIANSSSITDDFVDSVVDFIDDYELDGVELNWQTIGDDDESDNLEELLDELEEQLGEEGKLLMMALPSGEYTSANNINNDMFTYVDFANVHAFDSTDSDDLHSSFEDAEEAITYWTERCLIQNKLVLGVPFYSAGSAVRSYDYLIRDEIEYACVDESEGRDYNGIPTIIDKTNYAMLYAGGIMINSLEQDFYERNSDDESDEFIIDDYSLLNAINQTSAGTYVDICD